MRGGLRRPDVLQVLPAAIVVSVLAWTGGSLSDPDVWWHVRTGNLIIDRRAIPHTDPWSFTAPHGSWVPTSWLSDVGFGTVWDLGGVEGLRLLRVLLAVLVVISTWFLARQFATTTRDAVLATSLGVLAVAPFLRERPQVVSFILVTWLAARLQRVIGGELPHVLTWVAICWLWANLHGLWVLLPAGVLAAGVLAWCEDRSRVSLAARCTTVAILSWSVVMATPVGPRLAWWPWVVRHTAAPITEWQPTVLTRGVGAPLLVILLVLVIRWARSPVPVPMTRIAYVAGALVFGLTAYRNVAPAALLLVPELARSSHAHPPSSAASAPRTPRFAIAVLVTGLVLAGVHLAVTPAVSEDQPVALVERLAHRQQQVDLLNHYDVGGLVTGRASPPLHVAIDGRTDMWSPAFVRRYIDGLGGGDWRSLVDEIRPDAALLRDGSEAAEGLQRERHWQITDRDGAWVLLEPRP